MSTAVISSTRNTPGSVATTETRGAFCMVSVMTRMPAESRNVHEPRSMTTCGAEVTRESASSSSEALAMSSSPSTRTTTQLVPPIDGNGEVGHIPHESRV